MKSDQCAKGMALGAGQIIWRALAQSRIGSNPRRDEAHTRYIVKSLTRGLLGRSSWVLDFK